ncbi:aldehyde-activating protein, partial [Mycobacterium tuberculosis]
MPPASPSRWPCNLERTGQMNHAYTGGCACGA